MENTTQPSQAASLLSALQYLASVGIEESQIDSVCKLHTTDPATINLGRAEPPFIGEFEGHTNTPAGRFPRFTRDIHGCKVRWLQQSKGA